MDVLEILGREPGLLNPSLADGGLPPAVGVHNFQVFRASADGPELTDRLGWTYHHHVDMACWKGRLYVGWNSCQRDEDVWPSRELYSTSRDGSEWSAPQELFPQGVSTCLRMYFYHAANDRMLAIAGLRVGHTDTDEDHKFGLVAREIRPDHMLGDVFTLQAAPSAKLPAPRFDSSRDRGFVIACEQLLTDRMFLEQQDRGRLLGPRRMKWHEASAWPGGAVPGDNDKWVCGKAFSFFQRPDGAWVGVCKMGWVTISTDNDNTWSQPSVPPSLITGKAKVWGQRTADGRYALAYNPSPSNRFPLVTVTGPDGVHFGDMRIIQGELPIQRYAGLHRSIGPQYVRGISHWANDGSRNDPAMWLAYSMNKEDIWVARVPVPIKAEETREVTDDFAKLDSGPFIPGWNIYRPKWSSIEVRDGTLRIENRDPYDYAQATRVFPAASRVIATFDVLAEQRDGEFEVETLSTFGSHPCIRLRIGDGGRIFAGSGDNEQAIARDGDKPSRIQISADTSGESWVSVDDARFTVGTVATNEPLSRITFRTGPARGIGRANPVPPGTDRPTSAKSYRIGSLTIERPRQQ
jgi:hypothetical protein